MSRDISCDSIFVTIFELTGEFALLLILTSAEFYVMRQSYNLLFEKFLLVNFTRSIRMADEFRVMNSPDDLIRVRIDHWKLFDGHVLVDDTRLSVTSEREGGR